MDRAPEAAEPEPLPQPSRRTSWLKRAVIGACVLLVAGVCGIIVYAAHFFPADRVRTQMETIASDMLKRPVRIDSLVVNPFVGLEMSGIHIDVENEQSVDLDRVVLKYQILPLLRMRFVVDEFVVADTNVDVRLDDVLAVFAAGAHEAERGLDASDHGAASDETEPPKVPAIPLAIDLRRVAISNANVTVALDDRFSVSATGVNVHAAAAVRPDRVHLTGALTVAEIAAMAEGTHAALPVDADWDVAFDVDTETFTANRVTLALGSVLTVSLRGTVADAMRTRVVDVEVHNSTLHVAPLLAVVQDVLPEAVGDMTVAGTIRPELRISGEAEGGAFDGNVHGTVVVRGLAATMPAFRVVMQPTDVAIDVSRIDVIENSPDAAALDVALDSRGASFAGHALDAFDLDVTGTYDPAGDVAATLTMQGEAMYVAVPEFGRVSMPVAVHLEVDGNHASLDLDVNRFAVALGSLLHLSADAEVRRSTGASGTRDVDLAVNVRPNLAEFFTVVPDGLWPGVHMTSSGAKDSMTATARIVLDADHMPQSARVTGDFAFRSLGIALSEPEMAGVFDGVQASVDADYDRASGEVVAAVKGRASLSKVSDGNDVLSAGSVGVDLETTVDAVLSRDFSLERFVAANVVDASIEDIGYTTPEFAVGFDRVDVSVNAEQDLVSGRYRLDSFTIDADPVLAVNGNAVYDVESGIFAVDVDVPAIHLAHLIEAPSGEFFAAYGRARGVGTMGVTLQASGRIPDERPIDIFSLPVALQTRFQVNDVDVEWEGNAVDNAQAAVHVSLRPEEQYHAEVMAEFRGDTIDLSGILPIPRLTRPFLAVRLRGVDFDDLEIRNVTFAVQGAEVDIGGTVAGFREALARAPLDVRRLVGPVLGRVHAKASVDLRVFEDVLRSRGIAVSGDVGVDVRVTKEDRGPVVASVHVDSRNVDVELDGMRMRDVDGSIVLRKTLQWMAARDDVRPVVFHPTDRVPALRAHADPRRMVSFRELDIGSITLDNVSSHIAFDGSRFMMQNVALSLLNGSMGGDVVISMGETLGVDARVQLSAIDVSELLDEHARIDGDTQMTGTLILHAFLDDTRESIDFGSLDVLLDITAIGRDVLDRVLLFLDPEESHPMIAMARSNVALGTPSRVIIRIAKGMLGIDIDFRGGLVPGFRVDRIPVSRLTHLRVMDALAPVVRQLTGAVALIEVQHYGVDDTGTFVVR